MMLRTYILILSFLYIPFISSVVHVIPKRAFGSVSIPVIQKIATLFDQKGNENYMIGEPITQKEHAEQAAHIAYIAGADDYSIIAALLHDIGNFVSSGAGDAQKLAQDHAQYGGDWLKEHGFPEEVYTAAYFHTFAKVWLCKWSLDYFDVLSLASQKSYNEQKKQYKSNTMFDIMPSGNHIDFATLIALRRCDDMAKLPNVKPYPIEKWYPIIEKVLNGNPLCAISRNPYWKEHVMNYQQVLINHPDFFMQRIYQDRE